MDFKDFFKTHPALNVSHIEREAGMPAGTLKLFLLGKKPLPKKHVAKLEKVLEQYGANFGQPDNETLELLWKYLKAHKLDFSAELYIKNKKGVISARPLKEADGRFSTRFNKPCGLASLLQI